MIKILAIVLDERLDNNIFNEMLNKISTEKADKIKKIRCYQNAVNKLLGDILVRYLICKNTNLTNNKLKFSQNEFGKPYLVNQRMHFNISHSKNIVAVAISDTNIGIDIESTKIRAFELDIAKKYFCPNEYDAIISKQHSFTSIWTKKESYIKFMGKGLKIPLNSFDVFDKSTDFSFTNIYVHDDFVCNICSSQINIDSFYLIKDYSFLLDALV